MPRREITIGPHAREGMDRLGIEEETVHRAILHPTRKEKTATPWLPHWYYKEHGSALLMVAAKKTARGYFVATVKFDGHRY